MVLAMSLWNKKPTDDPAQSEAEKNALIDAFAAKMDEKLEAKFKPLAEKVESVAAWQTKIEEGLKEPPPDPNKHPDGTELTAEEKLRNENRALFLLHATTNARITESQIISEIERDWPDIVPEFRQACANTKPEQKALPNYEQNCRQFVDTLIGREARKKGLRYDKTNKSFIIEDGAASSEGDTPSVLGSEYTWQDPKNLKRTLTATQQLQKLKIDPKKFAEWAEESGQVS
jgi:hypothetical protein